DLVVVKVALAVILALVLGLVIALVFGVLASATDVTGGEPWARLPLLALGLVAAGGAFGAFGVLVGVLSREARTAVLVAFLVVLPLVLLGLLPTGTVTVAHWISQGFP